MAANTNTNTTFTATFTCRDCEAPATMVGFGARAIFANGDMVCGEHAIHWHQLGEYLTIRTP